MNGREISADEARGLLEGTTPGPWVNKLGPHAIPIVCGPTYDVAFTFYEDAGAGNDKADADAALLAAAPDLAATVIAQAEEIAALRAIVEGRKVPPTPAEIEAHALWCRRWLLRCDHEGRRLVYTLDAGREDALAAARAGVREGVRWWALECDGRPCAWPVATAVQS